MIGPRNPSVTARLLAGLLCAGLPLPRQAAASADRGLALLAVRPLSGPPGEWRRREGAVATEPWPGDSPEARRLERLAGSAPVRVLLAAWEEDRRRAGLPARDPVVIALDPGLPALGPRALPGLPVAIGAGSSARGRSEGLVLLAPLALPEGGHLDPEGFEKSGLAVAVLVHELFHLWMAEAYGPDYDVLRALQDPFTSHDTGVVTEPATALIEGLAEAVEHFLERRFPGRVYAPPGPGLVPQATGLARRLGRDRILATGENHWSLSGDGRVKDGVVDPLASAWSTEGVVATLASRALDALAGEAGPAEGLVELVQVLRIARPRSVAGLFRALAATRPHHAGTLARIQLEFSRYTSVDPEAAAGYRHWYQSRLAWRRGRITDSAWDAARRRWAGEKRRLLERTRAGLAADAAWPEPYDLELPDGTAVDAMALAPSALAETLARLGITEPSGAVAALVAHRARRGPLREGDELPASLPAGARSRIQAAHRAAVARRDAELAAVGARLRARSHAFAGDADPRFSASSGW